MLERGKKLVERQTVHGVFDVVANEHLVLFWSIDEIQFHSVEPLCLDLGGKSIVHVMSPYFVFGEDEFPTGTLWRLLPTASNDGQAKQ